MKLTVTRLMGYLCLLLSTVNCSPLHSGAGGLRQAQGPTERCVEVKNPLEPNLMSWDGEKLAAIRQQAQEGVVAVRYELTGCNARLEVLRECRATGKYGYTAGYVRRHLDAHDEGELGAEMPLALAKLGGKVQRGQMVRSEYVVAGIDALPAEASFKKADLQGADCERATHVVKRMFLGGFTMVSGERKVVEARATVLGLGAEGRLDQGMQIENEVGTKGACEKAQEAEGKVAQCSFPLRVGLAPLSDVGQAASAQAVASRPEAPAKPEAGATTAAQPRVAPPPPTRPEPSPTGAPNKGGAMVLVKGGTFDMGDGDVRGVKMPDFWLDKTEVTVGAYRECVQAGKCNQPDTGGLCNWGLGGKERHPVNCVSWQDGKAFCEWAGKRLPTEAEWEYAAKGGSEGRMYSWGSAEPSNQLCWNRGSQGTCEVGSFPSFPSRDGALDLSGNVWEWTCSVKSDYSSGDFDKCGGPSTTARVRRGGGFYYNDASYVRSVNRYDFDPSHRPGTFGFRCSRPIP